MDNFNKLGLSEEILKSLTKLGYEKPSPVQAEVLPLALKDKDIIVKSQTGSGKTAAFAIPICENIDIEKRNPQALILTPTRELAVQVKEDISNVGRFKKIRVAAIFGKQPMSIQINELKQRIHGVVGTPGRVLDHISRETLNLEDIKYLIIDEADEMLNMGFIDQVEEIIKFVPKHRVTMLFSATIGEEIETLCNKYMIDPIKVEINAEEITTDKITQFYYDIESDKKFNLLNKVIYSQVPESGIIFCNTKDTVNSLFQKMKARGYSCIALHGGMEQKDRLEAIKSFKRGEFTFLVATDVAARGLDIDAVSHVINYDIPMEKESYVHRIGRTGRAGKEGTAITFVTPYEHKFLKEIEEYLNYSLDKREMPSEEEVAKGKELMASKLKSKPKPKKDKSTELNKEITKLYIGAGKKKKIRVGDIVGTITSIEGITIEDVGIIDVQDNVSYVDILNNKGKLVLEQLKNKTIKGKKVKVERALR